LLKNNPEYLQVKNIIRNKLSYEGTIFSYPSDPIFYVSFKQAPPYYSNNYDSSANYAQDMQIHYIKENNVSYVIYNLKNLSVQDDVPNFIRTGDEEKYILNNFKIIDRVGKFLILQKNRNVDLFVDNNFVKYGNLKKYLTEINLESIPRSEGKYKKKVLQSDKVRKIGEFSSILQLNNFLKKNVILSKNKFLVFVSEESEEGYTSIEIVSNEGLKTKVKFKSCDRFEFCIINLSKIPLFYKDRQIAEIIPQSHFLGKISIIEELTGTDLWWESTSLW